MSIAARCWVARRLGADLVVAAVVVTSAAAVVLRGSGLSQATAATSTITAPDAASFYGLTPQFAVSPDGRQVVFVATPQRGAPNLWVRALASPVARPLPGTEQASYPFWSPDSQAIGFFASGKLKRHQLNGDQPVVVCDAPTGRGGTWNEAGVIVFSSGIGDPLRKVAAAGGPVTTATTLDAPRENSHRWPQFLAGGRRVLFWAGAGTAAPVLKIASLDSSETTTVGPAESNGAIAAGYVFFKSGNALVAQAFDSTSMKTTGVPIVVASPISTDTGSFFASFSVSTSGTVLYTRGTARPFVLTWFDRTGQVLGTVGQPGQYTNVNLGPDGSRLAVSLTEGTPANRDVWIINMPGGDPSRLTTDPAVDATPVWSPDGGALAFSSQRAGPYQIYRRATRPGQDDELVLPSPTASIATDWSPDGRFMAYTRTVAATGLDVYIVPVGGDRTPFPFAETRAADDNAAFSPDGRWIAYQSGVSGRDEIYVRAFPPAGDAVQVSPAGGTQPRWRGDSQELYYLAADGAIVAGAVTSTQSFSAGAPRTLVPATMSLVIRHSYAVTKDGQRFLVPMLDQSNPPVVTVVANWSATIAR